MTPSISVSRKHPLLSSIAEEPSHHSQVGKCSFDNLSIRMTLSAVRLVENFSQSHLTVVKPENWSAKNFEALTVFGFCET
jgi:hypothetical protein